MAAAQHADAVLVDCQPNTMHFRLKFLAAVLNLTHTHTHKAAFASTGRASLRP